MNKKEVFEPRKFMEMAVDEMMKSIQEPRDDKTSPNVGAILIKPDNTIEKAHRGELRQGDHAEFTLLERKNRSVKLDNSSLFVTLEPCAPGARKPPKSSCAERIINARIKRIWIGIEDPDPTVDRKGIKYLLDKGVEVRMFDPDLQDKIREVNSKFIKEALNRAKEAKKEQKELILSKTENVEKNAVIDDLSVDEINKFIDKAKLKVKIDSSKFNRIFTQLGLFKLNNKEYNPTGIGLLLFGNRPQLTFQNALIRATYKTSNRGEEIKTFEGSIVKQREDVQDWYMDKIGKQIDRTNAQRKNIFDYPLEVFREVITNAIVHRDYDIAGAPIYLEINDDAVIIKSPGEPVLPITFDQIKTLRAPSLSRNPKIMYVFDQLKLVEQRGLGFKTIKELPELYNIPLPIITYETPYIVMSLPRTSDAIKKLSPIDSLKELNDEELLGYDYIKMLEKFTRKDYENNFKYDKKKAERHLKHFVDLKLIKREGSGPGVYYIYIAT
jgi:ATP-dependent DNA helicase RecG